MVGLRFHIHVNQSEKKSWGGLLLEIVFKIDLILELRKRIKKNLHPKRF